jgi:hypothetical protein
MHVSGNVRLAACDIPQPNFVQAATEEGGHVRPWSIGSTPNIESKVAGLDVRVCEHRICQGVDADAVNVQSDSVVRLCEGEMLPLIRFSSDAGIPPVPGVHRAEDGVLKSPRPNRNFVATLFIHYHGLARCHGGGRENPAFDGEVCSQIKLTAIG